MQLGVIQILLDLAVRDISGVSLFGSRMTFNNTLVNAALFRKSDLEEVGCFPEKWKHYDEDWALYLKLLRAGKHPVHVPIIGFWYRRSNTGMQQTVRKMKILGNSRMIISQILQKK